MLVFALPILALGAAMMWRPSFFAKWQAAYYRKHYRIVAGPIGRGTRLFYFGQGVVLACVGLTMILRGGTA